MEKEWISVKEKPKSRGMYIGYFPDGNEGGALVDVCVFDGTKFYDGSGLSTAMCFEPTHWMEFPKPPVTKP